MPTVKIANPARILSLVNPVKIGGGHKMRKRKPAKRARKANPQKRVSIKVNGKRGMRYHAKRRRNPGPLAGLGIFKDGAWAAVGGLATVFARGFVPISFGGAIGDAGITAGLAYLIGLGADKLVGKEAAKMIVIGGVTVAVTNLLVSYGLTPQRLLAPAIQPQPQAQAVPGKGMNDIGLFPRSSASNYYGTGVRLPNAGMNDIGTFRRYAG